MNNIRVAKEMGWRGVLVGTVHRDSGEKLVCEHAELSLDHIYEMEHALPELFNS